MMVLKRVINYDNDGFERSDYDNDDNVKKVGRWEAGDEEWKAEIQRGLQGSGLVPGWNCYQDNYDDWCQVLIAIKTIMMIGPRF